MNEPQLGRFIWANVRRGSRGRPTGEHAAIILTTNSDYAAGKPIKVVVISSQLHLGTPGAMVMIKQVLKRPGGHPASHLTKESAAICDWIVTVEEEDIRKYCGMIYGKDLEEVLTCIKANQTTQS